ncbi:unnamed protein product, partial [Rotaria sp. Silwood2]
RRDSLGIRFYLRKERRQYDLDYLTHGRDSSYFAITIPPETDRFIVVIISIINLKIVYQNQFGDELATRLVLEI